MKKIIGGILIVFILAIIGYTIYGIYKENTIKDYQAKQENIQNNNIENNREEELKVEQPKDLELVKKEYKGYKVAAKLKIKKLDIDTYVLEEYTKPAMEIAVAKYFGPNANEVGNYCIAGHNYIRKNMFSKLGTLEVGDMFTLTDNYHGETNYIIYDKYKAKPTQTKALSQKTNGEKQVTLITCSDYSKKRIIIKAKEKLSL